MDMSETEACSSDSGSLEFFFESDDGNSEIDKDDVDDSEHGCAKRVSARGRIEDFTTPEKKVRQMVAMKGMKLLGDEARWRESVRQQMESELVRRVREALETPPLDRNRKPTDVASRQRDVPDINARLLRDSYNKDRDFLRAKRWRSQQTSNQSDVGGPAGIKTTSEQLRYLLPDQLFHSNPELRSAEFRPSDTYAPDTYSVSGFPNSKPKAPSLYTKKDFMRCLRMGRLPVGVEVTDNSDAYVDKFGVIRTNDGPFWPEGALPLFATPRFKWWVVDSPEPLYDYQASNSQTAESQVTQYLGKWKGTQLAYDSETSPRDVNPLPVPEGCCPTLMFESRFECGNLRQARRVNQFEYELVLKTDLYTARHTQWYYFRVTNAVPGVTYKLRIINLLKKDSLYNHGMRPLMYSEQDAKERQRGWVRTGHHISYARSNSSTNCPLLEKGITYYTLEWQMEFPNHQDTHYLAHCYPFSFTDLKEDLELLMNCDERSKVTRRDVLCETRAGNSCFLVTVTNFDSTVEKRAVIITARVHPGESQSSWMMKGFLEFITGPDPAAKELRNQFVFKVVPMINPDGVIVGNYRCSLVGRDLNRNYRHPRQESFPTIWYIKNMVHDLAKKYEVALYCDLHGHSRKHNVFMYGNNTSADLRVTPQDMARAFISERLFPWIMSVKSPDKFHFRSCKFQIRRCKESTGRVVMWRQLRVSNSFTMEATFSGTVLDRDNCRHFNTQDFMEMGTVLAQAILEYQSVKADPVQHTQTVLGLTRFVTEQVLTGKGVLGSNTFLPDMIFQESSRTGESTKETSSTNDVLLKDGQSSAAGRAPPDKQSKKDKLDRLGSCPATTLSQDELTSIVQRLSAGKTMDDFVELLASLDLQNNLQESDSSDSDSESEPEMRPPEPKTRKKRKKSKKQRDKESERKIASYWEKKKVEAVRAKSALPALSAATWQPKENNSVCPDLWHTKQTNGEMSRPCQRLTWFVSKYEGRHNGGFPCFTEERSLERAAKRLADHKDKQTGRRTSDNSVSGIDEGEFLAVGENGHTDNAVDRVPNNCPAHVEVSVKTGYTHAGNLQDHYPEKSELWEQPRGHWKYRHSAQSDHHNVHQNQRSGDNSIDDKTGSDNGIKIPLTARKSPYQQLDFLQHGSMQGSPFVQHAYVSPHPSWPVGAAASSPVPVVSAPRNRLTCTDNSVLLKGGTTTSSTTGNKLSSAFTVNNFSTRSSIAATSPPQPGPLLPVKELQQKSNSKHRQGEALVPLVCSADHIKDDQNRLRHNVKSDGQPTAVARKAGTEDTAWAVFNENRSGPGQIKHGLESSIRQDKLNIGQLVNNLEQNLTGVVSSIQTFKPQLSHSHSSRTTDHRSGVSVDHQVSSTPLLTTTSLAPSHRRTLTDNLSSKMQGKAKTGIQL